jgi:hypothetical protein
MFTSKIPDAPWCWNLYLHLPFKWHSFVGKYSSTMEHMGHFKTNQQQRFVFFLAMMISKEMAQRKSNAL